MRKHDLMSIKYVIGSAMQNDIITLIPVNVMGKRYEVPRGLTIMKALEYAGYRLTRGCGCRGGVCGACATIYRKKGEFRLQVLSLIHI